MFFPNYININILSFSVVFSSPRYLTNPGIEYLKTFLHLQPEIVPSTLKRPARTETTRPQPTALRSSWIQKDPMGLIRRPTLVQELVTWSSGKGLDEAELHSEWSYLLIRYRLLVTL
ncbi:hypothetical protein JTB14_019291 [Gonioctena quinquepunctata]|nr:hypothetical protein JTB14_019291 [Gonioctena quinquepunctata]